MRAGRKGDWQAGKSRYDTSAWQARLQPQSGQSAGDRTVALMVITGCTELAKQHFRKTKNPPTMSRGINFHIRIVFNNTIASRHGYSMCGASA